MWIFQCVIIIRQNIGPFIIILLSSFVLYLQVGSHRLVYLDVSEVGTDYISVDLTRVGAVSKSMYVTLKAAVEIPTNIEQVNR